MILFFSFEIIMGQPVLKQPDGGGNYNDLIKIKDEIGPQQRKAIINMLKSNEASLLYKGVLTAPLNVTATAFAWPLKQALGFNDNGYYFISAYLDDDPAYNSLLDYNCGNRTYDRSSSMYNHKGTDIATWPFYWQKMERDAVEIIAAAAGTIIGKSDGNYDQNCGCNGCNWNAVYVMHTDGSVAWYGHMKSGSLTTKVVGETVAVSEYLGVVGSSGDSNGPHLHFEVYTNSTYTQLVNPWAGPCNNFNGLTSWWANQQPYYVPTINKVMTHETPPDINGCLSESPNEKINFANGEVVYFGSYYRDQEIGTNSYHTVYKPDNSVFLNWIQTFQDYYTASWWYYYYYLPNPAATGKWRYEVVYNGKKSNTWFTVNSAEINICPGNSVPLFANGVSFSYFSTYQWQVNTGTGFINISDNNYYDGTSNEELEIKNIPSSFYGYQYRCVVDGLKYSNVLTLKIVSYWNGAVSTAWENPANWNCGNIPDANTDLVIERGATNYSVVSFNTSCRNAIVKSGAALTIKLGAKLNITGK